ncbi:MAG: hemerythrin domain-containing protein [Gammaproteobacteria bacterium]|jgi:hemerythrin-like domain-containing protein|nr:hemerythrin domain-containing protein [Gammaproteobacteria bacterium]
MQNVLKTLHTEHAHICRVLDFLEAQLGVLEQGGIPEWDLMGDVMHYMTNFPDLYHHPKEDLIFKRLRERQSGAVADIDEILAEHHELAGMGSRFRAAIQEVECGSVMSVKDFSKMARAYIDVQRRHVELEERVLFPLARQFLVPDDWQEVDEAIESRSDPVFGSMVKDEYKLIRSALVD